MRERSREGRKRYKTNVVILTFGEIWVKNTKEFFVLSLQLFCKSELFQNKKLKREKRLRKLGGRAL